MDFSSTWLCDPSILPIRCSLPKASCRVVGYESGLDLSRLLGYNGDVLSQIHLFLILLPGGPALGLGGTKMAKKNQEERAEAQVDFRESTEEVQALPEQTQAAAPTEAAAEAPAEGERETSFPIVGIGASAGGLEAYEKFFANMPPDSGMAFVLVQHLSSCGES